MKFYYLYRKLRSTYVLILFTLVTLFTQNGYCGDGKPKPNRLAFINKINPSDNNSDLKEINYLFEIGGYFGIDFINSHGENENFTNFSGLQSQLKIKKIMLSVDMIHFNRLVDNKQLIPSFFSNTYKISYGNAAAISIGYSDNKWVSGFSAVSYEGTVGSKTYINDAQGNKFYAKNALLKYSAPSYILGYQFTIATKLKSSMFQSMLDDYDKKHASKFGPAKFISGSIDLLYAPKVSTDSTFIYSPYGYYTPQEMKINSPLKSRHFGVQLKMFVCTPYAVGVYMAMGLLPGVRTTDSDNKLDVSAKVGVLVNLSVAR